MRCFQDFSILSDFRKTVFNLGGDVFKALVRLVKSFVLFCIINWMLGRINLNYYGDHDGETSGCSCLLSGDITSCACLYEFVVNGVSTAAVT